MKNKWSLDFFLFIFFFISLHTYIQPKSVREISDNEKSQANDLKNQSINQVTEVEKNPNVVKVITSNPILSNAKLSLNDKNASQLNQNNSIIINSHNNNSSGNLNSTSGSNSSLNTTLSTKILPISSNSTTNSVVLTTPNSNTTTTTTTNTNTTITTTTLDQEIKTTKIDDQKEEPNDEKNGDQKEEPNDNKQTDKTDEGENDNDEDKLNQQDFDDFAKEDKIKNKNGDFKDPPIKLVDIKNDPRESNKLPYDDDEESSAGFLTYFLIISGFCIGAYIVYHNKAKVLGLIIEGRNSPNRRRFNSRVYTRIENVQDAMPNAN